MRLTFLTAAIPKRTASGCPLCGSMRTVKSASLSLISGGKMPRPMRRMSSMYSARRSLWSMMLEQLVAMNSAGKFAFR